jgi:adenylate cyclase
MDPMEIERKWAVSGWPEADLPLAFEYRMEQGYVSVDPTVRIRKEERVGGATDYVLCLKSHGRLARKEIELSIPEEKFNEIRELIGIPLIRKVRRSYRLSDGRLLEVNHVDEGLRTEFWYAEVEYGSVEEAENWNPADVGLGEYLVKDETYEPDSTMGAFWVQTRLNGAAGSSPD